MELVLLFTGLIVGGILGWLFNHFRQSASQQRQGSRLMQLEESNVLLKEEILSRKEESEKDKTAINQLTANLASTQTELKNLDQKLTEREKDLVQIREKFTAEFKNLANEIFEEKSKKFTDQNKLNISEILNPLKEKIVDFEKKVENSSKESLERNAALKEQISGLRELNIKITREAENLVKALKGDNKAQGNWGEMILESILEKSGLRKDKEYFIQESFTGDDGRRYQPDVVLKLPEEKSVIIDSKVSLVAYEQYVNSEEDDQPIHLKNHLLSLRNHIKMLSEKKYQNLYQVSGLDFVLLFIPIEPAFSLAVQNDNSLFNEAYEKNIVIVSPTTLIATLRTIHSIWRQEHQNENAKEIARQSGLLYDKFVGFTQDLLEVGKKLKSTKDSYDGAMNKLTSGAGNLIRKTEQLRELGAKASKQIDERLINKSLEE